MLWNMPVHCKHRIRRRLWWTSCNLLQFIGGVAGGGSKLLSLLLQELRLSHQPRFFHDRFRDFRANPVRFSCVQEQKVSINRVFSVLERWLLPVNFPLNIVIRTIANFAGSRLEKRIRRRLNFKKAPTAQTHI